MPVTTFLHHKPSHPDEEINDCLNELNSYYNEPKWFADFKVYQKEGFLSSRITGSQLYYHLSDGDYQVINGADCDKSIKAYLYGCLNFVGDRRK